MNRKDQVDKDVQERLAYLRKKIPITTKYVESDKEAAKALSMRITPIVAKETTTLEDLQNANLQRQIAEENLKTIMKPADVADALRMLLELDDVVNFNSYFTGFKSEYRHQKNFTPEYFRGLWLKYSEKIDRETIPVKGMIPTRIPISRPSAEQALTELGQIEGEEPISSQYPLLEAEFKEKTNGQQQIIENLRVLNKSLKLAKSDIKRLQSENRRYKQLNGEDNKELIEEIDNISNEIPKLNQEIEKNKTLYSREGIENIKTGWIDVPLDYTSMSDLEKAKFYRESLDDYIRNRLITEAEASDTIPPKAYEYQILRILKGAINSNLLKEDGSINIGYNQYKYTDMLRNLDPEIPEKSKTHIPKHVLDRIYSNITKIQNSQIEGELADITTKIKNYTNELQDKNDAIAEKEDEIFRLNSSLRIKKVAEMDETKQSEFIKETAQKLRTANEELKTLKEERNKIKESTDIKELEKKANALINEDISKTRKSEYEKNKLLKDLNEQLKQEEKLVSEANALMSGSEVNRANDAKNTQDLIDKIETDIKERTFYMEETNKLIKNLQKDIEAQVAALNPKTKKQAQDIAQKLPEYAKIQEIRNSDEYQNKFLTSLNIRNAQLKLKLLNDYRDDLLDKSVDYGDILRNPRYRYINKTGEEFFIESKKRALEREKIVLKREYGKFGERMREMLPKSEDPEFYKQKEVVKNYLIKRYKSKLPTDKVKLVELYNEYADYLGEQMIDPLGPITSKRKIEEQIKKYGKQIETSSKISIESPIVQEVYPSLALPNNVMQMKKMLNELESKMNVNITTSKNVKLRDLQDRYKKLERQSNEPKYMSFASRQSIPQQSRRVSEEELLSGFSQASTPQQSRSSSQSTPKFGDEPRPQKVFSFGEPRMLGLTTKKLTPIIKPPSRKGSAESIELTSEDWTELEEKKSEGSGRRGGRISQRASNVPIKQRIIQGRGVDYEKIEDRYDYQIPVSKRFKKIINAPFGQYSIHLPSLVKNTINVRYMSGSHALPFPKDVISNELKSIILDIIEEGKYDEANYIALSEKEKKLFDDLITLAKVDIDTSLRMWRHKKYDDDEKKKKIDRFNLLKAQLLAGNDNKNIIREIKQLMLYLQEHKLIQKSDFNKIMYYIVYST